MQRLEILTSDLHDKEQELERERRVINFTLLMFYVWITSTFKTLKNV